MLLILCEPLLQICVSCPVDDAFDIRLINDTSVLRKLLRDVGRWGSHTHINVSRNELFESL